MILKKILILVIFLTLSLQVFANGSDEVATVLLMKGKAKAKQLDGKIIELTEGQKVQEGSELLTSERSFIKLIFIDKSTINVGPSSSIHIQAFPKKEAGIIKLIRGQIRAEVTKNYMEMEDKSKSKLYIQTNSAAMGIRGTDFQVNYNPVNKNSSLIVFEGKVAMAHIDPTLQNKIFVQNRLEMLVSNKTSVLVTQGQFSAVNFKVSEKALAPQNLGIKQLNILKENPSGIIEDTSTPSKSDSAQEVESSKFIKNSNDTIEAKRGEDNFINLETVSVVAPVSVINDSNNGTVGVATGVTTRPATVGTAGVATGDVAGASSVSVIETAKDSAKDSAKE
jgi:hypothetical protein